MAVIVEEKDFTGEEHTYPDVGEPGNTWNSKVKALFQKVLNRTRYLKDRELFYEDAVEAADGVEGVGRTEFTIPGTYSCVGTWILLLDGVFVAKANYTFNPGTRKFTLTFAPDAGRSVSAFGMGV